VSEDKYKDSYDTPLKKAKGLGSAHEGTHHWMMQKVTAIIITPLIVWLIWSIIGLQGASYDEFRFWLAQPANAVLMIMLIVSVLYHSMLGLQVVTEDYISSEWFKLMKLIGQKIFIMTLGVLCIFSILKIAFTVGV